MLHGQKMGRPVNALMPRGIVLPVCIASLCEGQGLTPSIGGVSRGLLRSSWGLFELCDVHSVPGLS